MLNSSKTFACVANRAFALQSIARFGTIAEFYQSYPEQSDHKGVLQSILTKTNEVNDRLANGFNALLPYWNNQPMPTVDLLESRKAQLDPPQTPREWNSLMHVHVSKVSSGPR